jgi:hypothetical protein
LQLLNQIEHFNNSVKVKLDVSCPTNISLQEINTIVATAKSYDIKNIIPPPFNKFKLLNTLHTKFFIKSVLDEKLSKFEFETLTEFITYIYAILIFKRYLPFCDVDILQYTLSSLKHNHVFKQGIGNGLKSLADKIAEKHYNTINVNNIGKIVFEIRQRVVQSIKSVVNTYLTIKRNPKPENICTSLAQRYTDEILMNSIPECPLTHEQLSELNADILYKVIFEFCNTKRDKYMSEKYLKNFAEFLKTLRITDSNLSKCIAKYLIKITHE